MRLPATEWCTPVIPAPRPPEAGARPADHENEDQARRERALAAAVVLKAIEDHRAQRDDLDAREAWAFLTAPSGGWKESRLQWCSLADLDPDALRARALAEQFGPPPRHEFAAVTATELEDAVFYAIEDRGLDWKTVDAEEALAVVRAAGLVQIDGREFRHATIANLLRAERKRAGLNNRGR